MVPRSLAVRVLTRVLSDHESLDEALAAISGEVPSDQRGWLQEVCSGTLRWKGRLDWVLDSSSLKKKPSGWLRKVLLIAAYQIIVQERTSAAAVVSETVSEVKRKEGEAPSRFANAVLRKIADHAVEWREMKPPVAARGAAKEAAAWASLPDWLWAKLVKQQGWDWACSFARATLERPKLWVAAKDEAWVPSWGKPGPVPGSWESIVGGSLPTKEGFSEGQFIVQDISSQSLVAEIAGRVLADFLEEGKGKAARPRALDLCAAPGGKSVGLYWKGFAVSAADIHERRLALLRNTVERVAPKIQVIDGREVEGLDTQDLVWVDAPCSGVGIIRRHPDVRWLRREKEISSLMKTQDQVLRQGWAKVRPGGFLAYSVCSVLKEEGPGALERAGLSPYLVKDWFLAPQDAPYGDGFWAGLLKKTEGAV